MIIWIASYPKSGNTWVRSLLSSYLFSKDGKFNFKLLKKIERFSVNFLYNNSRKKINPQAKIAENWISNQRAINKDKKIHILKTHNALCSINGNSFTDKYNTKAVIYIVRDPRNLILSLSHHYEMNHIDALDFITNDKKIIFHKNINKRKNDLKNLDFNYLGKWSNHYSSWINNNFCPIKIIKYEDLLKDTEKAFISILDFISNFIYLKIDKDKIQNSIDTTNFDSLSKMEKKENFEESVISSKSRKKINFFNLGKKNDWRKTLDKSIVKKIEKEFNKEMIELEYL